MGARHSRLAFAAFFAAAAGGVLFAGNPGLVDFGVAYYPEAWPEERWETDLSMMNELGSGDLISTRDLSLDEAYDHDEGAVARCDNRGSVRAEVNAGGVVGCVAFELSFDREDTLGGADYLPAHAEQLLFAVVRESKNSGEVL